MSFLDSVSATLVVVEDIATSSKLVNESFAVNSEVHYASGGYSMELPSGSSASLGMSYMPNAGEVLYLVSDRPVTIYLNGADVPFNATHLFLDGGNLTSVVLKNNQGNTAHLRVVMLGS